MALFEIINLFSSAKLDVFDLNDALQRCNPNGFKKLRSAPEMLPAARPVLLDLGLMLDSNL